MPTLNTPKSYKDGRTPNKRDLDNIVDSFEGFFNTTKIDDDNLQNSTITAAKLINSTVTEVKLNSAAVTTAKIGATSVTTAKLASDAVTNTKILDGNVTQAKLAAKSTGTSVAAGGIAIRSSASSASTGTISEQTISSVTITTTGRPVFLCLDADIAKDPGIDGALNLAMPAVAASQKVSLVFNSSASGNLAWYDLLLSTPAIRSGITIPPSIFHIDFPAAGTVTYSLVWKVASTSTAAVLASRIVAYEL